jgi:hypothetical protein
LVFITESPTIDFAAHRLSYTVPDDQLIASAIQFRDQTGSTVSFFSNDTGLRLKLRSRGMTGFTLPESERLPDEPDEETKKVRALEARLASFESRQPKLVLTFADGATHVKVKLRAIDRPEPAQSYFDYKISRDALERYGAKHSTYQEKHQAWASQASLRFPVVLVLTNAGNAVATDILLALTFPDFITALPDRTVLRKPQPPPPPANPLLGLRPSTPVFTPPVTPYVPRPTDAHIHTKDNTVTFRIPSFVQGRTLNLDPFVLMFDSETDIQNHSIAYSISLVEHPEGIRGSLHVVLDNDNVEHGN